MNINTHVGSVHITLSDERLMKNVREAQKKLNMQIVADCTPLVPFRNGALRGSVDYPEGVDGGLIQWGGAPRGVPYAHYQYVGYVRTDENGRTWVNRGESKPILTDRPLKYTRPGAESQWFEKAKQTHEKDWIDLVKRTAGGN